MDIAAIIYPVLSIGGIGLLFGVGLGIAAKKFAVPVDERVQGIKENLPGANCGGCGFAGCEALAKAIANGESKITACPVCNQDQVDEIAKIMGIESGNSEKYRAVVRCKGTHTTAKFKYSYEGIQTCNDANLIGGGHKTCQYGCLGFATCKGACVFGAITMVDGLPVIDPQKCVGCGACKSSCPRSIITILPADSSYNVNCVSKDKGKEVKAGCSVGCIGCGICVKQCESGAITMTNNLAVIDNKKCVHCGKCEQKCPTKAISNLLEA
ncbi:RnfABCDGE type electron transport complex subunit B [Cellulosilyticum sp. I15G10I2]|uniref:RnfABCDGE type electron transport complex subunit B n=1 Tax=Cellulosilyticum sp. I15G10I2 TaxID=1892843 RepID=UPI00085C19EE|nr:RnfABCDGE type electron transport complex subunit B [Cellulosilyticum sp. I15G10I2]